MGLELTTLRSRVSCMLYRLSQPGAPPHPAFKMYTLPLSSSAFKSLPYMYKDVRSRILTAASQLHHSCNRGELGSRGYGTLTQLEDMQLSERMRWVCVHRPGTVSKAHRGIRKANCRVNNVQSTLLSTSRASGGHTCFHTRSSLLEEQTRALVS